jgi:N-acyl-D-amino-acid deacylase
VTLDLVVRGGMIVDGSGAPRYRGDVGVKNGTIVELGRIHERGTREIDADGRLVTPGFIDGHVHLDAQVNWDPVGPAAWHGITTAVMGNCSFSLAPAREAEKEAIFSIFERAEDMAHDALMTGIDWDWETFPEWIEHLRRLPKGINYATQVGHSALRHYVMGERVYDDAPATPDDVAAMVRELTSALRAGAIGFSTSRNTHHWTSNDQPVPSRQAGMEELDALVDVLGQVNTGMIMLNGQPDQYDDPALKEAWGERVVRWAFETGRPIIAPESGQPAFKERYRRANAEGARLYGFFLAKPFDTCTSFRSVLAFDTLPGWKAFRYLPLPEQRRVLEDPERRAVLVHEAMTNKSGSEIGAEARPPQYDILEVLTAGLGPYRTVEDVAKERNVTPVDAMIDLSLESDFHQIFSQDILPWRMTPEDYRERAEDPHSMWGISDAGAHLAQSLAYDSSTFFLGRFVREQGLFTWEEGIRMLTGQLASIWGFSDRGLIREGLAADLLVLDPDELSVEQPVIENDLPGGAKRIKRKGIGFRHTIVNGVEVLTDNEPTGATPGTVLPGYGRAPLR